ncbi:Flotillin-1 [Toxocara canis]|uniref:Flotillin-1 n=1 Tax=Toxocara canis TaxID=6265 RepID=A0A0B2VGI4_TOXCA|nr:Flotillin-1 [Toxocara canis]
MFHTCGPNEAMVISGMFHRTPSYVIGGRALVWPVIQMVQRISLNTITLEVYSPRVYTQKGVPVSVTGIAQVKVESRKKETLAIACRLFLGKTEQEIRQIALETLEGHQRAIMGLMTVEEIYQDRKKFSEKVFEVAKCDLVNMGITVVSYTIKDIRDDNGYLKALGMKRTAQVKRDARIGEAIAKRDRIIKEALAEEERQIEKYKNDIEIAKAKRDYELKQAGFDLDVNINKAKADFAYQLQAAKTKQALKEEDMQVQIVERTAAINVAEEEITRKERELDAIVRRPAEAEKYRLEKLAKAEKQRIILEAEANAEAEKLRGEAEAYAIEMKGKAEADQLHKKAAAYKEFQEAALVEMTLDMLPKLADKIGSSLYEGVEEMKMISTSGGDVGAARLTQEVLDIMQRVPQLVSGMTGVDIFKVFF